MLDDIIRDVIYRAEKIQYQCIGSASNTQCLMYIKSNNEIMMLHDNRTIFRTTIPDYYEVHPNITYSHLDMKYDDKKEPVLNDLSYLDLYNLDRLKYCEYKYNEYIVASDTCQIIAIQDDLRENTSFQVVSNMKAGDGLQYFQVFSIYGDMIYIPYFVGLYGIKKADKYGIIVYDFDSSHFLVRVIDKKPKLNDIDIYMCILKRV